jgi:putative redox protein
MSQLKTLTVSATLQEGFAVHGKINGHALVIDQPETARGSNLGPTPLETFLFALAGCVGTIGRIIAMQRKLTLRGMEVQVEGDYNPAGLLGKPTDDRIGFQQLRITAAIDADWSEEEKRSFLDEVCHRCPLHDNVRLETDVVHALC